MSFAWHEIRDHLMQSSSTLSFQRSFDAVRRARAPLTAFRDPATLLDGLHRSSGNPNGKNLILAGLVRAAHTDGQTGDCALTLILLALWPGLDAIRRRCVWRKIGPAEDIAADILGRTVETIRGLDLQRVNWIAATVLRNVERDVLRAHVREDSRQRQHGDTDPDEIANDDASGEAEIGEAELIRDMQALVGPDLTLVIRVAIEGFSQAEVAIELGLSEAAARKRYQRALRKLQGALAEIP